VRGHRPGCEAATDPWVADPAAHFAPPSATSTPAPHRRVNELTVAADGTTNPPR